MVIVLFVVCVIREVSMSRLVIKNFFIYLFLWRY